MWSKVTGSAKAQGESFMPPGKRERVQRREGWRQIFAQSVGLRVDEYSTVPT
jgi:hypothetical protein